jgi:60 kDa SS-A/Ro ribonucleoprotein
MKTPKNKPVANVLNSAGGLAFKMGEKHALAQMAATGCFNNTFYTSAEDQLATVGQLAMAVPTDFLAKTAVYARQKGFMKDMPAFLCAVLSKRDPAMLSRVFPKVIDNGRMVRNFAQIVRSGTVGRTSLGSGPKRLLRSWFEGKDDRSIFFGSMGNNPSIGDVIKLAHPRPTTKERAALLGYLIGKEEFSFGGEKLSVAEHLPAIVAKYEAFRKQPGSELPEAPFEMLTGLTLDEKTWKQVAERATFTQTVKNLATFERHGVLSDPAMVSLLASRIADPDQVRRSRTFPYQLFMAWKATEGKMPGPIVQALYSAMEVSIDNVPVLEGNVFVFTDVSGSMTTNRITGERKGSTTDVRCIDVAALITASVLRKNPRARVLAFDHDVHPMSFDAKEPVLKNAAKLAAFRGGATNTAAPLAHLLQQRERIDFGLYVSDMESWVTTGRRYGFSHPGSTDTLALWDQVKSPNGRLVCVDLVPNTTSQAPDREDILNIGGFSDSVFTVMKAFQEGAEGSHWVDVIEKTEI